MNKKYTHKHKNTKKIVALASIKNKKKNTHVHYDNKTKPKRFETSQKTSEMGLVVLGLFLFVVSLNWLLLLLRVKLALLASLSVITLSAALNVGGFCGLCFLIGSFLGTQLLLGKRRWHKPGDLTTVEIVKHQLGNTTFIGLTTLQKSTMLTSNHFQKFAR